MSNFGIQEAREFNQAERDVFPGCPELKDGYYWANDRPGLGIELDETLAAKFPIKENPPFDFDWGNLRRLDGTVTKQIWPGQWSLAVRQWSYVSHSSIRFWGRKCRW